MKPEDVLALRYGRLLQIAYPRSYRDRRGEELLGTLMDAAGPGRRWPSAADVADLLGHGLRARTGLTADRAVGRTVALAAPCGAALAAGLSVIAIVCGEIPTKAGSSAPNGQLAYGQYGFGPFETTGILVYGLALLAFACVTLRALRPARALAALAVVAAAATHEVSVHGGTAAPNLTFLVVLALCLVPLTCAPPQAIPSSTRTRLLSAALVGVVSLLGVGVLSTATGYWGWADDRREAFYRSGSGLVPVLTPAIPVLAGLFLLGLAAYALAHRRLDVWAAGSLVLVPAAAWAYGGARIAYPRPYGYIYHGGSRPFLAVLGLGLAVVLVQLSALNVGRLENRPADPG